jgi:hypothetical protein
VSNEKGLTVILDRDASELLVSSLAKYLPKSQKDEGSPRS